MISIYVPLFIQGENFQLTDDNDDRFRKYRDTLTKKADSFYVDLLGVKKIDYKRFLTSGSSEVELDYQFILREDLIDKHLDKLEVPLIKFTIEKNMLTFTKRIKEEKVKILSLTESFGGYILLVEDPFHNIIEIHCEDFGDEFIDLEEIKDWNFYKRM